MCLGSRLTVPSGIFPSVPLPHTRVLLLLLKLIAVLKTDCLRWKKRKKEAFHNAHTISAVRRPLPRSSLLPSHCLSWRWVCSTNIGIHAVLLDNSLCRSFCQRLSFKGVGTRNNSLSVDPALVPTLSPLPAARLITPWHVEKSFLKADPDAWLH